MKLFNDYLKDNEIKILTPDTIYEFFKLTGNNEKTNINNLLYKYKVHLRRFFNYLFPFRQQKYMQEQVLSLSKKLMRMDL